ncbi:hypothetical protein AUEXF2481DRAFT_152614 [Aureobasidium subglaciale EXF-2481]|uniref:Uncharacterized protein n=1 Tax=Aureobasidium subglaciale (strain EXF-2481) TaxID=1043005 RepID=A0A074YSH8_AURSE|nr:uncharacterized protein AUEXF2481DRAFT_152614 [Aureobasidium subglaciale EXF-2481]KER00704.1 hypothetical protein AUEXF2481DRAFT_152614 [Aureobasidium subglaciale EXF-2481]
MRSLLSCSDAVAESGVVTHTEMIKIISSDRSRDSLLSSYIDMKPDLFSQLPLKVIFIVCKHLSIRSVVCLVQKIKSLYSSQDLVNHLVTYLPRHRKPSVKKSESG